MAAAGVGALDRLRRHGDGVGVDRLLDQHADDTSRAAARRSDSGTRRAASPAGAGSTVISVNSSRPTFGYIDPSSNIRRTIAASERESLEPALGEVAPELIELGDRLREVGVDRIELLDGREMRGFVLADQRPLGHESSPDSPGDRRPHGRIVEVQLGASDGRLLCRDFGLRLTLRRQSKFVLRLRRRRSRSAGFLSCSSWRVGLCQSCLSLGQCRAALCRVRPGTSRIDAVEHGARLDQAALLEGSLEDDAAHARADLGDPNGRDPAWQFLGQGDAPRRDGDDANFGRCRRVRGRRLLLPQPASPIRVANAEKVPSCAGVAIRCRKSR